MNWNEIFEYKDGRLFWKVTISSKAIAGKLADINNDGKGYRRTGYGYKRYFTHRIIFEMHHGYCPDIIDHIDRDKLNNKIDNLRPATHKINCLNKATKNGLLKGVKRNGKKYSAFLTGKYLGQFETPEQASDAYQRAYNDLMNKLLS